MKEGSVSLLPAIGLDGVTLCRYERCSLYQVCMEHACVDTLQAAVVTSTGMQLQAFRSIASAHRGCLGHCRRSPRVWKTPRTLQRRSAMPWPSWQQASSGLAMRP